MTREETIAYGKRVIGLGLNDETQAFCELAIKALEQEPCDDAISRQNIIDTYESCADMLSDEELEGANLVMEWVYKAPSVNQQEQTGRWVGIDEEPHEDYECDKCGYVVSTYTANIEPHTEYKFCPNCGCRMVEPQERGNKE